jgi:hypothetical protein
VGADERAPRAGKGGSMRRTHTQAERDAATVEIGFALVTATALAVVCYLAVVGLLYLADAGGWSGGRSVAQSVSLTVFIARVLQVLLRARSKPGEPEKSEVSEESAEPARADETGFVGQHDELGPVADTELDHRPTDMGLGRKR